MTIVKSGLLNIFLILLIFGIAIISCNDNTGNHIPVIEITSPFEGQEYFIPDTIDVQAFISGDLVLKSVKIGLVNEQFVSVAPIIYLFPESTSYDLEIEFPIPATTIETGNYYLYIMAENDNDFKNKYQRIHINGLPRVLEKIIVLTKKDVLTIEVSSIDPELNTNLLFEINGDYASSETDSKNRQLYVAGLNTFDIQVYHLETNEIEWQKDAFPPLPVHLSDCFYFDGDLYASYSSFFIYGFRYSGVTIFNTTLLESILPSRIMKFGDYLLADLQSKTGGFTYLATYYILTGVEKQRLQTNYKVVDFYDTDENKALVIGNQNGEGVIWLFEESSNTQIFLKNVPGKVITSVNISQDEYLVQAENRVLFYSLKNNILTEVLEGQQFYRLRFDPLNQKIYAAGANRVFVLNYPEIKIQNAVTLPDSILNLHLFFNR